MIRVSIYQKKKKKDSRMFSDISSAYWFVAGYYEGKELTFLVTVERFSHALEDDHCIYVKNRDYEIYIYDTNYVFADPIKD